MVAEAIWAGGELGSLKLRMPLRASGNSTSSVVKYC